MRVASACSSPTTTGLDACSAPGARGQGAQRCSSGSRVKPVSAPASDRTPAGASWCKGGHQLGGPPAIPRCNAPQWQQLEHEIDQGGRLSIMQLRPLCWGAPGAPGAHLVQTSGQARRLRPSSLSCQSCSTRGPSEADTRFDSADNFRVPAAGIRHCKRAHPQQTGWSATGGGSRAIDKSKKARYTDAQFSSSAQPT
jgi:hypothetical protein